MNLLWGYVSSIRFGVSQRGGFFLDGRPKGTHHQDLIGAARPTDVPDTGLICDLLWADPDKDAEGEGQ